MPNTASAELFDPKPYSAHGKRTAAPRLPVSRKQLAMKPAVWLALVSLKATLDGLPAEELDRRQREYEALNKRAAN